MSPQAIVAGHICLDLIPGLESGHAQADKLVAPGRLVEVGPAVTSLGGSVPNTGLALHRLGLPVRLLGKVGDDVLGRATLDLLSRFDPQLAQGMIVSEGENSSYTIVFSPPGRDRAFLHYSGPNDTFSANDIPYDELSGAQLFHFGYPTLMRRMYADAGAEMAAIYRGVKERGLITSLDIGMPDFNSPAGRSDWPRWLESVLPYVDVFFPSLDELLMVFDRQRLESLASTENFGERVDVDLLNSFAERLLSMGAGAVAVKLGDQGLYLRTGPRLAARLPVADSWNARELLVPCYQVEVVGTTGAGDTTIAGFLAALLREKSPDETINRAVAVGACSVEATDALTGIPAWDAVEARLAAGWKRRSIDFALDRWSWNESAGVWTGPRDESG